MRNVQVYKIERSGTERQRVPDYDGLFHQWATETEEFETGIAETTVAIVERHDGNVSTVMPEMIQFLDVQGVK